MNRYWIFFSPVLSWAANFSVSTNTDSGPGSLRQAILDLNASSDPDNVISINSGLGTIPLVNALPAISKNVQINGPASLQDIQANDHSVFFISPTISASIQNIAIHNAQIVGKSGGIGGGGGGGGLGAGAGLFVSDNATVAISNVTFTSCNATGGNGGMGGGSTGGGGGGGLTAVGANGNGNNGGAGGTIAGGGGGGRGGNLLLPGGMGGMGGSGGGAPGTSGMGGGLIDGGPGGNGGAGVYGGGGGGGQGGNGAGLGSNGGTGGNGSTGGFGGGGGGGAGGGTGILTMGAPGVGGSGGFRGGAGGNGITTGTGGGGGGAGLGGAIFVSSTGSLTITTPTNGALFTANTVTVGSGGAGSAGGAAGSAGSSAGLDLFIMSGSSCTFDVPSGTLILSNPIESDPGSGGGLRKKGAGTLDFATNNLNHTYTGGTTIEDGALSIASDNNLGSLANALTLNTALGTFPTLSIAGAVTTSRATTLNGTQTATFAIQSGASFSHNGAIQLNAANLAIDTASGTSSTVSGLVSGMGGRLTKTGTGTLVLSNASNAYSGGTTVSAGILSIASDGNLGDAAGTLALNGGTLQISASVSSARSMALSSTSQIDTNGNNLTLSGMITGSGALVKQGMGMLSMTGTSANMCSGLTTVAGGELSLNKTGVNAIAGDLLINGGTLTLAASNQIANTATLTLENGAFNLNGNTETLGSLVFRGGVLTQDGATLTLTNLTMRNTAIAGNLNVTGTVAFDNTNNGTAIISGNLDLGGIAVPFDIAKGAATTDMSISGVVNNGGVTKTGSGVLEFTGASPNSYTGLTTVTAGQLLLNKPAGMNAIGGNATINGGTLTLGAAHQIPNTATVTIQNGIFNLNGNAETYNTLVFQGGSLTQGGATLTLTNLTMRNTSIAGNLNVSGIVAFDNTNNGTAVISGDFDLSDMAVSFDIAKGAAAIDMSISGPIHDGAVVKMGEGVLQLTGSNSYVGGTTVSAGTLQGNTASLQGNIVNQAVVIFDQAVDGTYAGTISGSGSLVKQNSGALILAETNTYSGGTSIYGGSLRGNAMSIQGNIANQAVLIFDQAVMGVHEGNISGSGSVIKQNSGTLILRGVNTYLGGTDIQGGTLRGSTRAIQGNISNQASLIFDQAEQGTYLGNLTGTGTLIKEGNGALDFTGDVTQTMTFINMGKLNINGTLTSNISIAVSGALGGTGTITGNVVNSGVMSPGSSIGTTTIVGDYTQATGSTLQIEINPTVSDLLQVTGSVMIHPGATLEVIQEPGIYAQGTRYTIVTAGGGVSGQFSTVQTPFTCSDPFLVYLPNEIQLVLCTSTFSQLPLSGNAEVVSDALDQIADPSADFQSIIEQLQLLDLAELQDALDQLQPSLFKGLAIALQNHIALAASGISQHLEEFYKSVCQPRRTKRVQFWISPLWNLAGQTGEGDEPGWQSEIEMVEGGGDCTWGTNWTAGAALGIAAYQTQWDHSRGKGHGQSYFGGIYGNWTSKWMYANALFTAGFNHRKAFRTIRFSHVHRAARHSEGTPFFQASTEMGALLPAAPIQFRPFGNLSYTYLDGDEFKEKGANSLNLQVQSPGLHLLRSELGLNMTSCISSQTKRCIPEVHCSWVYEQRFSGKVFSAQFDGTDPLFHVKGLYPSRSLLSLGGAIAFQKLPRLISLNLFYDALIASRSLSQSVSFLFHCPF